MSESSRAGAETKRSRTRAQQAQLFWDSREGTAKLCIPGFAAPAGGRLAKAELIAGLHVRGSRKWIEKGTDFEFSDLTAPRYAEPAK